MTQPIYAYAPRTTQHELIYVEKINKGCALVWVGVACCKKEKAGKCIDRWDDGGCRGSTFCDFKCKDKCTNAKSRGCKWSGSKCTTGSTKTSKPTKAPTKSPTKKPTEATGYEAGDY